MSTLTCPKCHADMRQYERNGVHVDQCGECRGIFLDRGELEHLVDAELRWASQSAPPPQPAAQPAPPQQYPPQPAPPQQYPPQQAPPQQYASQGYPSQGYGKPKKRKSFLEELFD